MEERITEKYLRRILEAKEEKASISTRSKKIKTEHSTFIKQMITLMNESNVECIELSTRDQQSIGLMELAKENKHIFLRLVEMTDREPKVMPRHVNLFAKQWYESKDSCVRELRDSMDIFLKNVNKHLENFKD